MLSQDSEQVATNSDEMSGDPQQMIRGLARTAKPLLIGEPGMALGEQIAVLAKGEGSTCYLVGDGHSKSS
jgi:hypothetical protein